MMQKSGLLKELTIVPSDALDSRSRTVIRPLPLPDVFAYLTREPVRPEYIGFPISK